ncbi:YbaK/EbsC family protein [Halobaculum litoreum]|uniref:YbaK/EbsC family protein n=1 Tax=Halobaculum litoreum TaxID=3031998 RepID=A0ABD5XNQ2_9EURY|nr:YbaK/EbsC family protein [Halobaculum sp. DT92]
MEADAVDTASPDPVEAATGWSIGGVPPFGRDESLPTYPDDSLLDHDRIWGPQGRRTPISRCLRRYPPDRVAHGRVDVRVA